MKPIRHSFPQNIRVSCSTHYNMLTDQDIEDLLNACDASGVEVIPSTRILMKDPRFPYYTWYNNYLTQTSVRPSEEASTSIVLPFKEFLAYARGNAVTPAVTKIKYKSKFLY